MKEIKPINQPEPAVVNLLESMLEDARSGDIRSVAVAAVRTSGETCCGWGGHFRPVTLIGELAVIQREVMDSQVDLVNKPAGRGYEP